MNQYKLLFLVTCLFSFVTIKASASVYQKQSEHGLPMCDNAYLLHNVKASIEKEYAENPPSNTIEKRNQLLMLKDINGFAEVSSENFLPEQDFNVAKKLITLKINQHMKSEDIRVCKSTGSGLSKNIYLLLSYQNYEVLVDITNFSLKPDFIIKYTTINQN